MRRVLLIACVWLAGFLAIPAEAATNVSLMPLLRAADGRETTSARAWKKHAEVLRQEWQEVLGPIPAKRPRPRPAIIAKEALPGFTRLYLQYEAEPGVLTDGYLLEPMEPAKRKRPAVAVFHPTTPLQAKGVAGVAPDYPADKHHGVQLVRLGFVVWCPRNFINSADQNWLTNTTVVLSRHTDWTGMTRMLLDAMRAADFLERWPGVDAHRIGCLGHSLGAKQVLYAMAFDPRYKAGVFSEGGIGLGFSNWDAPWYLGPRIKQPDFAREHHELLALIAPRPFLLIAGGSADDERSGAFVEAARPVYRLLGDEGAIEFLNHRQGHAYPSQARQAAERFLVDTLKAPGIEDRGITTSTAKGGNSTTF